MEVIEVLLSHLGEYDENSERVASNEGLLTGKYGLVYRESLFDEADDPFLASDNDFRIDHTGASNGMPRESHLDASEAATYHYITAYRRTLLSDAFIDELQLAPQLAQNIKHLQYRRDLVDGQYFDKARFVLFESPPHDPQGIILYPDYNGMEPGLRSRRRPWDALAPLSHAYHKEGLVGDYAGLVVNWITEDNTPFPTDFLFGEGTGWHTNVLPAINDGISGWVAYRLSGTEEIYQHFFYGFREWAQHTGVNCGVEGGTPLSAIPCDKGQNVRNVMMFNELDTSRNGVFPFGWPTGMPGGLGPAQSDLAALYFPAIFYDIAHEVGLGVHKADLLFWKTISLIDDKVFYPMRKFGQQVQDAVRLLWPDPMNPGLSIYEQDIHDVLISRGIAVDAPLPGEPGAVAIGAADFKDALPTAIGDFPATLEKASSNGFGSSNPDSQPTVNTYGQQIFFWNGYFHPDGDADYVTYQFVKHSKYGPCDKLHLTDGSFTNMGNPATDWQYNNDGTYFEFLEDRELNNLIVFSPGTAVRWLRERRRCANEAIGFYGEDVRPFGFRVIKATSNGFSFTVERLSEDESRITYELTIVDPSLNSIGAAVYEWTFTEFDGAEVFTNGQIVQYAALRDQPFTISIDRTRGETIDNLTLRERGNDLDRPGPSGVPGTAFVFDAVSR